VFSVFFYNKLTTRPEDQIEADIAKVRHSRVELWTDNFDIFDKDFLFVPIYNNGHWFLAIICFPGLNGSVGADGRPGQLPQRPLSKGSATRGKGENVAENASVCLKKRAFNSKSERFPQKTGACLENDPFATKLGSFP
jgi:Ulp1 family protease